MDIIKWKRRYDHTLLFAFIIIMIAVVALASACRTTTSSTATVKAEHKTDSSSQIIHTLQRQLDSVVAVIKKHSRIQDSSVITPAQSIDLSFNMVVDSNRAVKPFHTVLKRGDGYLHVFSNGDNTFRLIDSTSASAKRYRSELSEVWTQLYVKTRQLQQKDSALTSLKLWTVMNATREKEVVYKTSFQSVWIMLAEAGVIIFLLTFLYIRK